MAKGIDELAIWLVKEISFCSTENGFPVADFIAAVEKHYCGSVKKISLPGNESRVSSNEGNDAGSNDDKDSADRVAEGHEAPNAPDIDLVRRIWEWVVARDEVLVGRDGTWNHLSLDEVMALPELESATEDTPQDQPTRQAPSSNGSRKGIRNPKGKGRRKEPTARPRLFVTEQTAWMTITGHDIDLKRIPRLEWACLRGIASAKEDGILQPDLRVLVNQDKRSLPRRTDFLAQKGYILKRTVVAKGFKTSRLWLKDFGPAEMADDGYMSSGRRGNIDLSAAALKKDLEPVAWCSQWQSRSINFALFGRTLIAIVKARSVMRIVDLKMKMGVRGQYWQMRTLSKEIRRLVTMGLLQYVAAQKHGQAQVYKDCIKHVRDPTREDWNKFMACGKKSTKYTDQTFGRQPLQGAARLAISPAKKAGRTAGDENDPDDDQEEDVLAWTTSSWVPEKPFVNLLVETIRRAGSDAISCHDACIATVGYGFRRPVFGFLDSITEGNKQPEHLQHFQIRKELVRDGKTACYKFRVDGSTGDQVGRKSRTAADITNDVVEAATAPELEAQASFGFPAPPPALANQTLELSLSDLSEQLDSQIARPKAARGRPRKQPPERKLIAVLEPSAAKLPSVSIGEPSLLSEPHTGRGRPRKSLILIIRYDKRKVAPFFKTGGDGEDVPGRPAVDLRRVPSIELGEPLPDSPGDNHSPFTKQPSNSAGFLPINSAETTGPASDSPQPSNVAPSPAGVAPKLPVPLKGRGTWKRKASGDKPWKCEKCGNSWKNIDGLKYHQRKSQTTCNPNFDPAAEQAPRKRRKIESSRVPAAELPRLRATTTRKARDSTLPSPTEEPPIRVSTVLVPSRKPINDGLSRPRGLLRRAPPQLSRTEVATLKATVAVPTSDGSLAMSWSDFARSQGESGVRDLVLAQSRPTAPRPLEDPQSFNQRKRKAEEEPPGNGGKAEPRVESAAGTFGKTPRRPLPSAPMKSSAVQDGAMPKLPRQQQSNADPATATSAVSAVGSNSNADPPVFVMPHLRKKRKMAESTLRTYRCAEIIRYLLDNSDGVFPAEKALWYGVVCVYKRTFPDEDLPHPRSSKLAQNKLTESQEISEHVFSYMDSTGAPVFAHILVRHDVDPLSRTAIALKDKMKASHPTIYIPPAFSPSTEDREYLIELVPESKLPWGSTRRNLAETVEIMENLDPVEQLDATVNGQPARKRKRAARTQADNLYKRLRTRDSTDTTARYFHMTRLEAGTEVGSLAATLAGVRGPGRTPLPSKSQNSSDSPPDEQHGQRPQDSPVASRLDNDETDDLSSDDDMDTSPFLASLSRLDAAGLSGTERSKTVRDRPKQVSFVDSTVLANLAPTPGLWRHLYSEYFETQEHTSFAIQGQMPDNAILWGTNLNREWKWLPINQWVQLPGGEAGARVARVKKREEPRPRPNAPSPVLFPGVDDKLNKHRTGRPKQPQLPVLSKTREHTAFPQHPKDYITRADATSHGIDWGAEDTYIAAFVAVCTLLGGVDSTVDWGLLMRLFPLQKVSRLRKFWRNTRKDRPRYIEKMSETFRRQFLAAYERGDLPPVDFDNILAYDWRLLIAWTVKLVLQETPPLSDTVNALQEGFEFREGPQEGRDWRDMYYRPSRSVWDRLEGFGRVPAAMATQPWPTDSVDALMLPRSWLRSLTCTTLEKYSPDMIVEKLLTIGPLTEEEIDELLITVIKQLQRRHVIRRSRMPGLQRRRRPFELSNAYNGQLTRLANAQKFKEAAAFKAELDESFRRGEPVEICYALTGGCSMALFNLQAHGRIEIQDIDRAQAPWGWNESSLKETASSAYNKHYKFRMRVVPTETYLYNEDISVLEVADKAARPGEQPTGEMPIWCDFFGEVDQSRWARMLASVLFKVATRGSGDAGTMVGFVSPLAELFEINMIINWAKSCGLLLPAESAEGILMAEGWWLAVARQLERGEEEAEVSEAGLRKKGLRKGLAYRLPAVPDVDTEGAEGTKAVEGA